MLHIDEPFILSKCSASSCVAHTVTIAVSKCVPRTKQNVKNCFTLLNCKRLHKSNINQNELESIRSHVDVLFWAQISEKCADITTFNNILSFSESNISRM